MREKIAIAVCLLAFVLVLALSYVFAVRHNPESAGASQGSVESRRKTGRPDTAESKREITIPDPNPVTESPDFERGRTLYERQGCSTCHSIVGIGNPRHPLDGTGDRWTTDELPHWILGTGDAAAELSTAVRRRKQRYHNLPPEDLNALVSYLSSLKN